MKRHEVAILEGIRGKIFGLLSLQKRLMKFSDEQGRRIGWRSETLESLKKRAEQLSEK